MNQTRRILTLGDLQECLVQFPPNTTIRVTARETDYCGLLSSPMPDEHSRVAIETYGEARGVEDLINALVVDHVAAIMRRDSAQRGPNVHIGSRNGKDWWTECLGCASCDPDYEAGNDTLAPRGSHGG